MYFDRFDICAAYYIFCSAYHAGQNSFLYQKLSQLCKIGYKPGLTTQSHSFENDNQREIYRQLYKRYIIGDVA